MELSRLNLEYNQRSAKINCRKDEVSREKWQRLLAIRMQIAAKKDEIRTSIEMLRNERLKFEKESTAHEEKSEAIRRKENRIHRLKEQAEIEMAQVRGDAYATRLQLDEDARRLTVWLETEKLRLMETYEQEHPKNEN